MCESAIGKKRCGFEYWRGVLGGSTRVVAPMVDQSELAWRLLSRRHGAQLCYTPMLHASIFVKDARYRKENFVTCEEDRPLIVQFCANDPDTFLEASRLVEGSCDGVDLNLGCPQAIARRGHYGAYLQDDWDLIAKMVNVVHTNLSIPITSKIRVFDDVQKTVKYAQMLEAAGCLLLAVHGRTREQKGLQTGAASWQHIKAVKENVAIPVFANGNIQYPHDVEMCLQETGADGVMIAEGSLHNPALFEGGNPPVWEMASEYLDLVEEYPCPTSYIRGHLFKLFHHCLFLPEFRDLQEELGKAGSLQGFRIMTEKLRDRFKDVVSEHLSDSEMPFQLPQPVYICQPYVRPVKPILSDGNKEVAQNASNPSSVEEAICRKRSLGEQENHLSKRKLKKLKRNPSKKFGRKPKDDYQICGQCFNPKGAKCGYSLCRACCRVLCFSDQLDCLGHRLLFKTKKEHKVGSTVSETSPVIPEVT